MFIRVCFCDSFLKQYFRYFLKPKRLIDRYGSVNEDQSGAIIQLFTDVENLPSGNIFSFQTHKELQYAPLTDMCVESSHTVKKNRGLS